MKMLWWIFEKLFGYCLNESHYRGKHKAAVFKEALEITEIYADHLKELILEQLPVTEAIERDRDEFGIRYSVDMLIRNFENEAVVRTNWIIRSSENFPRLTTCFVKSR